MKISKKNFVLSALIPLFALMIPFSSMASDLVETEVHSDCISNDEVVSPTGSARSCPYSSDGLHGMQGRTQGVAYDKTTGELRLNGFAFQCIYCNLILITENNPMQSSQPAFGNYAMVGTNDPVPSGVVKIWTNSFGYSEKNSEFSKQFQFIRSLNLNE